MLRMLTGCDGIVKPAITFFGEALPDRFEELVEIDFPKADLLIGTACADRFLHLMRC